MHNLNLTNILEKVKELLFSISRKPTGPASKNLFWNMAFIHNDANESLDNWCDLFSTVVKDHIPKCVLRITTNHPSIESM